MSLNIDVDQIVGVLLADGWHEVSDFYIDAVEFVVRVPRGNWRDIESEWGDGAGFSCTERIHGLPPTSLSGPMSSILAVREETRR